MTRKILITGGKGQLGQSFQWLNSQAPLSTKLQLTNRQELDICDSKSIERALAYHQPTVVINAAAYTAVDKAESEPDLAYAINAHAVELLASACARRGIRFIHISTDYVFDGHSAQAYAEDAPTAPNNIYGKSKLAGEQAALATLANSIILRTSWIFSQFGNNFLTTMLKLATERDSLQIVNDQIGGPSYAPAIAKTLLQLAVHPQAQGIYHFSGSPHVSWFEFAQTVFKAAQERLLLKRLPYLTPISTQDYLTPANRPAQSGLSMERLHQLGMGYNNNWHEGIQASLSALSTPALHISP
ncbi:dTDP-4-dehydrorhamnose reductase [Alcaligenes endophyticus]|uniref:dTDP-4-dehydrorhamnose reductase n=1 Tax=Alcaligenes endophyticus TaxID=1929088 RepID=A0ABT8EFR4_9BURK|nr:dTDP-4-dehydrorhamnose reductase [Alcaligenes endophyticus]MCX5590181.1 dTDP-4-dehydrorhamnose reductase [Alcaligenes endophyticus]MDN4120156.1 dTDP-4-dehydrorhamnose reductase [Alcaligenes endophyticus]